MLFFRFSGKIFEASLPGLVDGLRPALGCVERDPDCGHRPFEGHEDQGPGDKRILLADETDQHRRLHTANDAGMNF